MKRCRWCGQFVRADQEPTTRTLTAADPRTVRQMLCPECSASWSIDSRWNHEPDYSIPVEVLS